ncbi:MAG: hypothetical protein K2O13_02300, partial [Lachnospiraceae bacterium]|nr:hypothetical protein [Lachnospiraceae bacterium]
SDNQQKSQQKNRRTGQKGKRRFLCLRPFTLECDAKLIARAINNLVQNNGVGISAEKLEELESESHT